MVWNESLNRRFFYECLNIIDCQTNRIIDSTRIRGNTHSYGWGSNLLYHPSLNKIYFRTVSSLLVVECANDSVIAQLPVPGWNPQILFHQQANKIYASTNSSIVVIDCLRDSIIKTFPNKWILPLAWPKWVEYNKRNNKVYLGTSSSSQIWAEKLTIIDGERDSILTEITISPVWLSYDENHNRLYCVYCIGETYPRYRIAIIDGESNQIIDTLFTGVSLGGTIVWNPLSNKIYAVIFSPAERELGDRLAVIDGRTHQVIKYLPIAATDMDPSYLTVNTTRNKVYCTSFLSGAGGRITGIDGERDTIITVINIGSYPCKLDYNFINDKVYCAADYSGLVIIDGAGDTIITYVPLPFPASTDAPIWHPGVNKVYCGSLDDNRIAVIDGTTNRLLKFISIEYPYGSFQYTYNLTNNKLYCTFISPPPNFYGGFGIVDAVSDTLLKFLNLGPCSGITWNAENNKVYFLYNTEFPELKSRLGVIDCQTDSLIRRIPTSQAGWYLCWNPENNKIYTELDPYGVEIYDGETDSLLELVIRHIAGWHGQPFAINLENDRVYYSPLERGRILVLKGTPSGIGDSNQERLKSKLQIYPNPASSFFNIRLPQTAHRIKIYDVSGRLIRVEELKGVKELKSPLKG